MERHRHPTPRARETENQQSKLSAGDHELLPNSGASALAGRINPQMEAVEAINGTEDAGR
jgi:hypothetical protein